MHKLWAPEPNFCALYHTAPIQLKTSVWAAAAGNARPKPESNQMEFEPLLQQMSWEGDGGIVVTEAFTFDASIHGVRAPKIF